MIRSLISLVSVTFLIRGVINLFYLQKNNFIIAFGSSVSLLQNGRMNLIHFDKTEITYKDKQSKKIGILLHGAHGIALRHHGITVPRP